MDTKAILKLNRSKVDNPQNLYAENYDLLYCEYSFTKDVDKRGFVNDNIITGNIVVALAMLPNDKIMSWVLDVNKKYNGEITLNNDFSESSEKIYFEDARPIGFRLHYEASVTTSVTLILTINAGRIVIGESEYQNKTK